MAKERQMVAMYVLTQKDQETFTRVGAKERQKFKGHVVSKGRQQFERHAYPKKLVAPVVKLPTGHQSIKERVQ
jgi:hypothetical protein